MTDVLDVEAPAGVDEHAWFADFERALTESDNTPNGQACYPKNPNLPRCRDRRR